MNENPFDEHPWISLFAFYVNTLGTSIVGWMCFKVAWEWIVVELLPGAVAAGTVVARIPWDTLPKLLAVVESYPDLKANKTISDLMEELTSTENKISFARQAYNDAVTDYNTKREQFPNNVISSTFNFQTAALLEAVEKAEERTAPKVSFT